MFFTRSAFPLAFAIITIVEAQAQPSAQPNGNAASSQLLSAIKDNQLDAVKRAILEGAGLEEKVNGSFTPLMVAVGGGNPEIVRSLLVGGANPNARTDAGLTPLMVSVIEGKPAITTLLINAGASAGEKNAEGLTALDLAIGTKNADVVKVLKTFAEMSTGPAGGPTMEETAAYIKEKLELVRPAMRYESACSSGNGTVISRDTARYSSAEIKACRLTLEEVYVSNREGRNPCFPIEIVKGTSTSFSRVERKEDWKADLELKSLFLDSSIKVALWVDSVKINGPETFAVHVSKSKGSTFRMRRKVDGLTLDGTNRWDSGGEWEDSDVDSYSLAIGTKEEAERVAKALTHAAHLCGARKELF